MYAVYKDQLKNQQRFRQKNHERILLTEKETRKRLRKKAVAVLGSKCIWCGIDNVLVLQVDHLNGGGNRERQSLGSPGIYRKIIRGSNEYQLLCANCNLLKKIRSNEVSSPRRKY